MTEAPPMQAQIQPRRHYKYYDLVMVAFVTVLLCSNLIGPGKSCVMDVGANVVPDYTAEKGFFFSALLVYGAGNMFFPFSYIFGDVLTEVYGYARARKVVWAGFGALIFATIMSMVVLRLRLNPQSGEDGQKMQDALGIVFGNTGRIVGGSLLAFWVGDFVNSYVLAKMKIWTGGRLLWTRTIGSTFCGQFVDSMLFYPIAFYGIMDNTTLVKITIFNWLFKVSVEVVLTPATYAICGMLKRAEGVDHFDRETNFTPFSLKD